MRGHLQKIPGAIAAVAALVLLASCLTFSLHPLYDDKDSVFEPNLIGTWRDTAKKQNPSTFVFEKSGADGYTVTFNDTGDTPPGGGVFEVHLVTLHGRLFFDAVQTKVLLNGQQADVGVVIPSHLLGRIYLDGDTLHYDSLDDDWLKKGFQSGKITLAHELVGDDVVLTASTADLRRFLADHANDEAAFAPNTLQRVK